MKTRTKAVTEADIHIGSRVRVARGLAEMNQERLAELLGLTFQQVQKYEKGVNRIGAGRLFQIAGIFNRDIGWFFEGLHAHNAGMPPPRQLSKLALELALQIDDLSEPTRSRAIAVVEACLDAFTPKTRSAA